MLDEGEYRRGVQGFLPDSLAVLHTAVSRPVSGKGWPLHLTTCSGDPSFREVVLACDVVLDQSNDGANSEATGDSCIGLRVCWLEDVGRKDAERGRIGFWEQMASDGLGFSGLGSMALGALRFRVPWSSRRAPQSSIPASRHGPGSREFIWIVLSDRARTRI